MRVQIFNSATFFLGATGQIVEIAEVSGDHARDGGGGSGSATDNDSGSGSCRRCLQVGTGKCHFVLQSFVPNVCASATVVGLPCLLPNSSWCCWLSLAL